MVVTAVELVVVVTNWVDWSLLVARGVSGSLVGDIDSLTLVLSVVSLDWFVASEVADGDLLEVVSECEIFWLKIFLKPVLLAPSFLTGRVICYQSGLELSLPAEVTAALVLVTSVSLVADWVDWSLTVARRVSGLVFGHIDSFTLVLSVVLLDWVVASVVASEASEVGSRLSLEVDSE